jgi:hypothetical protein
MYAERKVTKNDPYNQIKELPIRLLKIHPRVYDFLWRLCQYFVEGS